MCRKQANDYNCSKDTGVIPKVQVAAHLERASRAARWLRFIRSSLITSSSVYGSSLTRGQNLRYYRRNARSSLSVEVLDLGCRGATLVDEIGRERLKLHTRTGPGPVSTC